MLCVLTDDTINYTHNRGDNMRSTSTTDLTEFTGEYNMRSNTLCNSAGMLQWFVEGSTELLDVPNSCSCTIILRTEFGSTFYFLRTPRVNKFHSRFLYNG